MYYFNPSKYHNFPTNFLTYRCPLFFVKAHPQWNPAESETPTPPERVRDVRVMFTAKSCPSVKDWAVPHGATFPVFRWLKTRWNEWGNMVDLVDRISIYYMYNICVEISWDHMSYPCPVFVSPYLVSLMFKNPVKNPGQSMTPKQNCKRQSSSWQLIHPTKP